MTTINEKFEEYCHRKCKVRVICERDAITEMCIEKFELGRQAGYEQAVKEQSERTCKNCKHFEFNSCFKLEISLVKHNRDKDFCCKYWEALEANTREGK